MMHWYTTQLKTNNKLAIFGDAQEFKMVRESIEKLSEHFELVRQHPDDKIDKYILFEYTKGFTGKPLLSGIYDAIYEKKEISFTHCRFESDEPTERILQPYILKEHRNRWYVIGKEEDDAGITVSLQVKVTPEFIRDCILRYGDAVKVISPVPLADKVQQIYLRTLDLYESE